MQAELSRRSGQGWRRFGSLTTLPSRSRGRAYRRHWDADRGSRAPAPAWRLIGGLASATW